LKAAAAAIVVNYAVPVLTVIRTDNDYFLYIFRDIFIYKNIVVRWKNYAGMTSHKHHSFTSEPRCLSMKNK